MFKKITTTVFNGAIVLGGIATAVWLTITGNTLQIEGLMLAMGALLAAVIFGFRLIEGLGSDKLSIWVGPISSLRARSAARNQDNPELREAA